MTPNVSGDPRVVVWSWRLYRLLTRIYPREFRVSYSQKLEQAFLDLCRDACRSGTLDLMQLWVHTLWDLFRSAYRQHTEILGGTAGSLMVLVGLIPATLAVFVYAPTEATMGTVQRIFYFHVSAGLVGYIGFFVVFASSIGFLLKRDLIWDRVARCSAEVAVLFASINLMTGVIWAKPIWGIWWVWDARLTLQLVLWASFIGYLMLGAYIADPRKRATVQAAVGILAFLDVPVNYMAIRWWRTQHPSAVLAGGPNSALPPDMFIAFIVTFAAFLSIYTHLVRKRMAVEETRQEIEYLQQQVYSK